VGIFAAISFHNYPLTKFWTGLIIIMAISITTLLGYFNATNIKLKNLEFTFPKMGGNLDEITILFSQICI